MKSEYDKQMVKHKKFMKMLLRKSISYSLKELKKGYKTNSRTWGKKPLSRSAKEWGKTEEGKGRRSN